MANTQHLRSKKEMEKKARIDELMELWKKYHGVYSKFYAAYVSINPSSRHYIKLSLSEFRPSWSKFLLIDNEHDTREYFARMRPSTLSSTMKSLHPTSIEYLINNMREALRSWHYWNGAGLKGGTEFGAKASSCTGTGRHFSNRPEADSYLKFF